MSDSTSQYRQLSVLLYPSKTRVSIAVVARSVVNGRRHDRILLRGLDIPQRPTDSVAQCLRAAAAVLVATAESLDPTPEP